MSSTTAYEYFEENCIFYLMILHLYNDCIDNIEKEEVLLTLEELIKYFKIKQSIKIKSFEITDKIDCLFSKYDYLFKNIKITNETQIIKDIHKLILKYNKKVNNKNFEESFYEQLLLIACKNNMLSDIISFVMKSYDNTIKQSNNNNNNNNYIQFKLMDDVALLVKEN